MKTMGSCGNLLGTKAIIRFLVQHCSLRLILPSDCQQPPGSNHQPDGEFTFFSFFIYKPWFYYVQCGGQLLNNVGIAPQNPKERVILSPLHLKTGLVISEFDD